MNRPIDLIIDDKAIEVRYGTLKTWVSTVIVDVRRQSHAEQVSGVAGTVAFTLFLSLYSVDKHKSLLGLSEGNVEGVLIAICSLSFLIFIVATYLRMKLSSTRTAKEYVDCWIEEERAPLMLDNEPTAATKGTDRPLTRNDDIFLPLELLSKNLGVIPVSDFRNRILRLLQYSNPDNTLEQLERSRMITIQDDVVKITPIGRDYYVELKQDIEKHDFYGTLNE